MSILFLYGHATIGLNTSQGATMVMTLERLKMATKKPRVVANVDADVKAQAQQLADLRNRSISNLIETLLIQEIEQAKRSGELMESSNV